MIKVLQYIGSLTQGGSQTMIMNLYRNIDRSKVQFDFVIHAGGMTELALEAQELGATIYNCPSYSLSTVSSYSAWWRQFFIEHPEYKIVHSHVRSTAAIVLGIAKKSGCVTIAHSHSTSSGSGVSAVIKNLLQYRIRFIADYFMGCSQVAGEWLFGKKTCGSDRYFNIKNAIDAQKFVFDESVSRSIRSELGFSDDDFVIGNVGRLTEAKNHEFIISVFKEIHNKDSRYKLLLVGDGELREHIFRIIEESNLGNSVQLVGMKSNANQYMMAMDLFLFPSKWEGLGIVLIEAQAAGCNCIASSCVPMETQITDLVEYIGLNKSVAYWTEKILEKPRSKHEDMHQSIIDSGYDIYESAKWIEKFYENIAMNLL